MEPPSNPELVLAPLAKPETLERVQMDQIDSGPVDYVVKCTEGLFAGRFIYVNRTPQGELFGSDKGSKDITMYIENGGLSSKHTEIKFNEQTYQYFLRDVASADGTWVRIRWNRSIEIAVGQELKIGDTILEVREGPKIDPADEVRQWLSAYQLQRFAPGLRDQGVFCLQHIRERKEKEELVGLLGACAPPGAALLEEERGTFRAAIAELDKMFPPSGFPGHALEFAIQSAAAADPKCTPTPVCTIAWEGGTIALMPAKGVEVDGAAGDMAAQAPLQFGAPTVTATVAGWERCEWLRIGYTFGRYYVHFSEQSAESSQKGWVRLRSGQKHWLQPHDLFGIGTLEFQVLRFNAAVHSEQGFRATMEDEDILLQDLATSNWRHCSFFGVYDGHGGRECASFVRQRLHMNFVAALHARAGLDKSAQVHHDVYDCLVNAFSETDRQFLALAAGQEAINGASGCAAVVACIIGGWVWCANCGDSRALLSRDGRAVQLSLDHKPDRQDEAERIEAAGGFVSFRRVLGRLAVSRAFGDQEYKVMPEQSGGKPLVTADPEIRLDRLTPQDEFMLLACDGLFDVFSSQEAVDFVRTRLAAMPSNEQDPHRATQDLVHEAIHERRSRDNVTALLVTFKRSITPHNGVS